MNPAALRFGGRGVYVSGDRAAPGDAILVSGTLGDHGIAVLSKRESLAFETEIVSDSAALHGLVADMVAAVPSIYCLRDPTRGGLGATLNEIAQQSRIGMRVAESAIPFKPDVLAACERACADRLLAVMRAHPPGRDAAIIGEVVPDPHAFVHDANPVWRQPHSGLACRRPAAENLLSRAYSSSHS